MRKCEHPKLKGCLCRVDGKCLHGAASIDINDCRRAVEYYKEKGITREMLYGDK